MSKLSFLVILLAMFTHCACPPTKGPELDLKGLDSYYYEFLADGSHYGKVISVTRLTVKFEELDDKTLGQCWNAIAGDGDIVLNTKYWNDFSNTSKKVLMYHEMGHCLLGRDHRTLIIDGKPASIMNDTLIRDHFFEENKQYYLQEMFTYEQ